MGHSRFSIQHSVIDVILLWYFTHFSQKIMVALCLLVIVLNAWNFFFDYLSYNLRLLRDFTVELFHSTAQIFYLSLSIAYYGTNDRWIDFIFVYIFMSFAYHLYDETREFASDLDNNRKMKVILCLCVMLDYIQVIILILSKLYVDNHFYFYKFLLISYPFTFLAPICCIYDDVYRQGLCGYLSSITLHALWTASWIGFLCVIGLPLVMEALNASWIVFLYTDLLGKYRNATNINEEVKDELVQWLQTDQPQLLVKLCILNHITFIQHRNPANLHNRVFQRPNLEFLEYLQNNVECNKSYYKNVTWSQFKERSGQFKDRDFLRKLTEDIKRYYEWDRFCTEVSSALRSFQLHKTFDNFHELLRSLAFGGLLAFTAWYAVLTVLNIFVWPVITLWITWETMSIHQAWFNVIYFILMFVILYKLYHLIRYEVIMWYVMPNIGHFKCNQQEIKASIAYYNYIHYEIARMRVVLQDIFGADVGEIVLLYTPDYIRLYDEQNPAP